MPTPSHTTVSTPPSDHPHELSSRPSCPPETRRHQGTRIAVGRASVNDTGALPNDNGQNRHNRQNEIVNRATALSAIEQQQQQQIRGEEHSPESQSDDSLSPDQSLHSSLKRSDSDEHGLIRDAPSPTSTTDNTVEADQRMSQSAHSQSRLVPKSLIFLNSPYASQRFLPNSSSSFLRPGSRFRGTQQSDRQIYEVQVDLKHVDMNESFLCGYLRIQGLTDDHPTLTTYFESEIVGTKYTFQTRHPEWGSNEKVDMQHWGRFPAWRPLAKQAKRPDFSFKNFAQRENIFMRWKEYFLVPDHRILTISGASFEGYYYICFNQIHGSISGIYFHAKSEKYQQLELQHVADHGCMGAMEFR